MQVEVFSCVLTVVKKCITVVKLCNERFAFYFFICLITVFFSKIATMFLFLLLYFWRKTKQKPFCLYFIWMLNKKALPLHRFSKKLDITDPKQ